VSPILIVEECPHLYGSAISIFINPVRDN
jgi:hypothetical protein